MGKKFWANHFLREGVNLTPKMNITFFIEKVISSELACIAYKTETIDPTWSILGITCPWTIF